MTPQSREIGIRELRDQLSRIVDDVERGDEIVITNHGRPVARLSPFDQLEPLADLRARGLVREPTGPRWEPSPIRAKGTVSDFVSEQRR